MWNGPLGFGVIRLETSSILIRPVPRKPIELPPEVAREFLADKLAFFAENNAIKADAIAARQLHALRQYYPGKLRLTDIKEMFLQMRDQA
jgi:hypothetical protein